MSRRISLSKRAAERERYLTEVTGEAAHWNSPTGMGVLLGYLQRQALMHPFFRWFVRDICDHHHRIAIASLLADPACFSAVVYEFLKELEKEGKL